MSIIVLRSPRYESLEAPSGAVSVKLALTVGGTLRYTIIKDCTAGDSALFKFCIRAVVNLFLSSPAILCFK